MQIDEELQTILDVVGRFAEDNIDARKIDLAHGFDRSILEDLGDLGVFGASIPEEYGGLELGLGGVCCLVERMARVDRAVATTVGLHLGLGTRGLIAFGSEEQKQRYLPELAAGTKLAAFAATEPGAGSDLAAISTKGVVHGNEMVIDGAKIFVTNGGLANVFTIVAFTPGLGGARRGHSVVVLEDSDPGVVVGAEEEKLGLRGSSTVSVNFDGARIPLDRVVGQPGKGQAHMSHILAWGRTAMAAGCCGTARSALDATTLHVQERKQFRRPLAKFAVVQQQISEMVALHYAMWANVMATAKVEETDELDPLSLVAKVFNSESNWDICDLATQLHGGSGYIEETGIPLMLRDARITRIFEGANDVLVIHCGTREALVGSAVPVWPDENDPLVQSATKLRQLVEAQRQEIVAACGVRLIRKQRLLHRLGRLVVLRDTSDAVVRRAHLEGTELARLIADHWLHIAHKRALPFLKDLAPLDKIEAIAMAQYEGEKP
ncbi:MAG: hypothetical protein HN348_15965 [Proteobacteria bacterium]|jgi:acyl-CoA dehydrogenase|nr:hypothetical protein [Pseudomonadota bacterium]